MSKLRKNDPGSVAPPGMPGRSSAADLAYGRPIAPRRTPYVIGGALLVAVVLAGLWLALHTTLSRATVHGDSMEPTLTAGESVSVEAGVPLRAGDIVILHPSTGADESPPRCGAAGEGLGTTALCDTSVPQAAPGTFVKRIVAGPGDRISVVGGQVVLGGVAANATYAAGCTDASRCDFPTAVTVPPGEYFVLGDNRGDSDDSRFWGPVPGSWIVGTVVQCGPLATSCSPLR